MFIRIFLILFSLSFSPLYAIEDFTHESEFSSVASRGNSPYESYLTKTSNRIIIDRMHDVTFGGHYAYGSINDEQLEIARNWDFNAKYLAAISEKTYGFFGGVVEGDEFAGYSERNNIDLGLSTKYIYTDDFKLYVEYGYRQTVEVPIDNSETRKDQKLRFYGKIDEKISENASYTFWLEYIPNLTTPEDYMINLEPALRVTITKIFSLKVAYKAMYDNMPAIETRKYLDETYTTSLLAKF
jgi:putative salt-induced outer membrane protein YdiY